MLNKSAAQMVLTVFPELQENKETRQEIIDGILASTSFPWYKGRSPEARGQMLFNDLLLLRAAADKAIKSEEGENGKA